MTDPDRATANQLRNIQSKTGKTLDELAGIASGSGLTKHGELRSMFMAVLGLGHGDANALVHAIRTAGETPRLSERDDVLVEIYAGPKAELRPIHDALMARIEEFGPFEVAPKKGYVSLRTTRQFAMIGPATKTAVELGINAKSLPDDTGWTALPAGNMCNFKRRFGSADEITDDVIAAIKVAYES